MDMEVEGRHVLLFDDDTNAAFVNSPGALVPWNDDSALLIDRYDVRHLLDRIPPRPPKRAGRFVEDTGGVPKSQLDLERYQDLNDDDGDEDGKIVSETSQKSNATGSGAYQAVPFSYGNSDISADPNSSGYELNDSGFRPPFSVPESLLTNLPPTEKLHQIIARTAIFVSEHGGQSEIVLRVKQGDNLTFGFLMPDNHLHPYFRFLVDNPQLLKVDNGQEEKKSDSQENDALEAGGGALSLLGSVYGSGEDDDSAPQPDSKELAPGNPNVAGISVSPHESDKEESNSNKAMEEEETIKHRVIAAIKEKTLLAKRKHPLNASSIIKKGDNSISIHGTMAQPQSSHADKTDVKPLILEPPSFLKRTIEKIVAFILRNGKEFEAVLIEQDKAAGRFPFLLSSNQYHSYYLKVLQEALESKLLSKNSSDGSKRSRQEAPPYDSTTIDEQPENWSLDPQRKEKFKMVIGAPKKDSHDQPPKPARQYGVTADEAAAIVLAATRGRSPATLENKSITDSDTGRTSSIGQQRSSDVSVAAAIAKTVALAASSEADSSEASLTKEQKVKAERLKRAKMFAAMIKSGSNPASELAQSGSAPTTHVESSTARSTREEREGSSMPFDAGPSHRDRKYRKKHRSRSLDPEEGSEEDHKLSWKKQLSDDHKQSKEKGSRHHRHHHRHKRHSDSDDEQRNEKSSHRHHHHKHHSDSEDEQRHEKSSRFRHRHRDSSEDDDCEGSHKKRSKHRSHSERGREIEATSGHQEDVATSGVLDSRPCDITEVPSDLRAKVRAMLMETL